MDPNDYNTPDADRAMARTRQAMQDLTNAVDRCPSIDPGGHSDCPFAEGMYRAKENVAWELSQRLKELYTLMQGASAMMERFRRERDKHDHGSEEYQRAELWLNRHTGMYTAMLQTSKHGYAALRESKKKKFPGVRQVVPRYPQPGHSAQ